MSSCHTATRSSGGREGSGPGGKAVSRQPEPGSGTASKGVGRKRETPEAPRSFAVKKPTSISIPSPSYAIGATATSIGSAARGITP
jgi:hypothetical protein